MENIISGSDFTAYLKTLNPEDWDEKATEKWTVKDVVAHMVGWEKEDAQIIGSIWKSKKAPWFYETNDYDDFNKKSVEHYKDYTPSQLIGEWEKWRRAVEKEISRIGEDKMKARPDLFGWLFKKRDDDHYNHHYRQIRKTVSSKNGSTRR